MMHFDYRATRRACQSEHQNVRANLLSLNQVGQQERRLRLAGLALDSRDRFLSGELKAERYQSDEILLKWLRRQHPKTVPVALVNDKPCSHHPK